MNSPTEPAQAPAAPKALPPKEPSPQRPPPRQQELRAQHRTVRTRKTIIAVAAQHFDTDRYGHTRINTISGTGKFAKGAMY